MVLKEVAIHQLQTLKAILIQLSEKEYVLPLDLLDGISLGKHVRHTLEFHQCLMQDLNTISYDSRERNPVLESNPLSAIEQIDYLSGQLRFIEHDRALHLSVDYADTSTVVHSTLLRELAFLIEHTVHHFAIMRIALTACFRGIAFEPTFGYADSTIRFHHQSKVAI